MKVCPENQLTYENTVMTERNVTKLTSLSDIQIDVSQVEETRLVSLKVDISEEARKKWVESMEREQEELPIIHNPGRLIIPNIQTNELLVRSLEGAQEEVIKAVYDTICNDLLNGNVGDMSEDDRQQMIALGLEKAKYIASNHLKGQQADNFLKSMDTIAKYAINGTRNEEGYITYHIEKGPLVGAPDDYLDTYELMRRHDPETYEKHALKLQEAASSNDYSRLVKVMKEFKDWVVGSTRRDSTLVKEAVNDYVSWKKIQEETALPTYFTNTDTSSKEGFVNSLLKDNQSNNSLQNSINRFFSMLQE